MKRALSAATLLASVLMLAACNSATSPDGGTGGGTGTTTPTPNQPVATGITVGITRAVTLGPGIAPTAELRVEGTTYAKVKASIESAPTGLSVTTGTISDLVGGGTIIPLSFSGSASNQDVVKVNVTVSGNSVSVNVPILNFGGQKITGTGLPDPYQASRIRVQPDGRVLLSAGLGDNTTSMRNLVRFTPTSASFELLPFNLTGWEGITSFTTAPDGNVWATVRGMTTAGSYLLRRSADGSLSTFSDNVGAQSDNLNNLTSTADGRIWFTQNTRDAVKALTPSSGSVKTYTVSEEADSLVTSNDGKLYYAAFYARPAIVQLDPSSGASKTFNVGDANRSLPIALTPAPDGTLWFIEARTGSVWQLNPSSGKQTPFELPVGARPTEITITPAGQVWVADPTNARLYTTITQDSKTWVIGVGTPANGPRALTSGPDGKVWYEAGGQLTWSK